MYHPLDILVSDEIKRSLNWFNCLFKSVRKEVVTREISKVCTIQSYSILFKLSSSNI